MSDTMKDDGGRKFVRGHMTMIDGTRVPLTEEDARKIVDAAEAAETKRAADMPTSKEALSALHDAITRLKALGWRDGIYCPKDGSPFAWLEFGSTGTWRATYSGEWPTGYLLAADCVGRPEGGMWKPIDALTPEEAAHMQRCENDVAIMTESFARSLGAIFPARKETAP